MFGDSVPGYSIGAEVGRGSVAVAYRGKRESDGIEVILKQVNNDAFGQNELELLCRVRQANPDGPAHVVRLLDFHRERKYLWLVLEAYDEILENLDAAHMTPMALMSIALDAAKGLVEMLRAGVIDDDVKPANLALKTISGRVAHIDLDCARLSGQPPSGRTDGYAAPEIMAGRPSDTSPCFGWARTVEFLACGKIGIGPSDCLSDFIPWIGRAFAELVSQCCLADPRKRPSIQELNARVESIVRARRRCACSNAVKFADGACPVCLRV